MAIAKIIYKENASATPEVWMDTTQKTVTSGSMLSGTTALKNDGTGITGNIASKSSSNLTASGATVTAPAGYYASDASKSVASGTAGTPTATKGTVSNNSVSVTPSVTNTTGYITGGTKTGTAVTVSASELVSGTKAISASGTTDVTNYASASVAAGSATTPATSITANPTMTSVVSSGKNLFDMSCLLEADGWTESSGDYSGQIRRVFEKYGVDTGVPIYGSYKANTQYTVSLSSHIETSQSGNGLMASAYYTDNTHATLFTVPNTQTSWSRSSGTTASGKTVSAIIIAYNSGGAYVWHIKEAQIEEGATLTAYTPYAIQANVSATVSASQSVTPTVSAGYVSSGTSGTVSVSGNGSETVLLSDMVDTTQSAQTIHPSTTDQTIASGTYLTGTQTIKAVTTTNLTAANIVSGVTVKIGDSTDDDCVASVTGTASGGGGVTPAPQKQVNFIDYDGTIVYSYTATEANALTSLPSNPSHDGLTAQGWNWTLQQIKSQLSAMPNAPVWIGQMYITTSGKTEIDVRFVDAARLSPYMSLAVNGTVSINWGDNSTADTVTGTSLTTQQGIQHTYPSIGDYTITVSVTSGSWTFYGSTTYMLLYKSGTVNNASENRAYSTRVLAVRIGSNTGIGTYAFYQCYSLSSITIPNTVTSIGDRAFSECYGLNSLTLPSGITDTGNYLMSTCHTLRTVSLPGSVTSVGTYLFNVCASLPIVTVPSGITSIGAGTFRSTAAITSIIIPSGVTSIGTNAFQYCYGLKKIRFEPQTPPTLAASTVFQGLPTDCVISVPAGKLSTYTGTSNYPSSSTYTYIEE